jgi:hypothetical protein
MITLSTKPGESHSDNTESELSLSKSKVAESATLVTRGAGHLNNAESALLTAKPGAGLDAQDLRIAKLLSEGWPPQRLVVELDVEMSDILRVAGAARVQS